MPAPTIRFVLETHTRSRDINGTRYHFGIITSTRSGRTIRVGNLGGNSNLQHDLRNCGIDWHEMHCNQSDHPIRRWNELFRCHDKAGAIYEHELTKEMLLELERNPKCAS